MNIGQSCVIRPPGWTLFRYERARRAPARDSRFVSELGKAAYRGMVGLFLAIISFFLATGHPRCFQLLKDAGKTLARWKVSAEEWSVPGLRHARIAQGPALDNEFRPRKERSPVGVEVIFGRHQVIADGRTNRSDPGRAPPCAASTGSRRPSAECLDCLDIRAGGLAAFRRACGSLSGNSRARIAVRTTRCSAMTGPAGS